jgi:DNA-binding NarL/FixJ family response regulator
MSRIRVLIADDHAVVREGLTRVIADQADMRVVAQVGDGETALLACREHEPHVVLLDMRMPGLGGVAAIRRIREHCPTTRLLVLSMYEDQHYVRAALAAGAHAYLGKRSSAALLLSAIRALSADQPFTASAGLADDDPLEQSSGEATLSAREREIMRLVVQGHTSREMASALGISKSSVDTYRARVFRKLGVDSRAALFTRIGARSGSEPEGGGP